jgi:thermitase
MALRDITKLLLVFLAIYSVPALAREPQPTVGEFAPGEVLVKFKPGASLSAVQSAMRANSVGLLDEIPQIGVKILSVPVGRELEVVRRLLDDPSVEYAEPNYILHALPTIPNDGYYTWQWGMEKIQAPSAWDITTGASNIIIAIVDTGVDLDHPDLDAKVVAGYDFVNNDNNPQDDNGHGTHCAGIAAAETNNNTGVAGVSWGAKIMPVKVLDDTGSGLLSWVISGIIYAADNGAKVINLSLGGEGNCQASIQDAITYAHNRGALVVAAMGNCADPATYQLYCSEFNPIIFPASCERVVAVGATDSNDNRASFSGYRDYIDVAAPGVGIYSTWPWLNGYRTLDGTSMAAPHVSGLAALIWSVAPGYTPDQVEQIIKQSADDVNSNTYPGKDDYLGWGRINAYRAVSPDLYITKTNGIILHEPNTIPVLTYTISYGNEGIDATGIIITETLPVNTIYIDRGVGWTTSDNSVYTYSVGSLLYGDSGQVTFTVQVSEPLTIGQLITNVVSIGSPEAECDSGDNVAIDVDSVFFAKIYLPIVMKNFSPSS